jgi:hypothetical protein
LDPPAGAKKTKENGHVGGGAVGDCRAAREGKRQKVGGKSVKVGVSSFFEGRSPKKN